MIYQATKVIEEAIRNENFKCEVNEVGNTSCVKAAFHMKGGNSATITFISADEYNDVAVRVFDFLRVPEEKLTAVRWLINEVNRDFRYAKFTLQDNGTVYVEMDVPQKVSDLGPVAVELLLRAVNIMEEAYPGS